MKSDVKDVESEEKPSGIRPEGKISVIIMTLALKDNKIIIIINAIYNSVRFINTPRPVTAQSSP